LRRAGRRRWTIRLWDPEAGQQIGPLARIGGCKIEL
jgi:hypothetical protein